MYGKLEVHMKYTGKQKKIILLITITPITFSNSVFVKTNLSKKKETKYA